MARKQGFFRRALGALMALVGIGAGQLPAQPNVPAPTKEYIAAPKQQRAARKKKGPRLAFTPKDPTFPIIKAWLVPGSTNTYGLGALTAKHFIGLSKKEADAVRRGYCERLHLLQTSQGSQATINRSVA